jgi:hypothetical protein
VQGALVQVVRERALAVALVQAAVERQVDAVRVLP